ncbi:uncharacterized protein HMPREF1541_01416 [Cyphellophora europaea CBS 101466]|uniref:Uncharacterized protein n=1 Tax=Cyphellophora europaea (strain CBS 101466) TaxID=1220924 RepID=W2SF13_CYPE1|nr:uncharacterized protein HMPREF1541_01416 [Cyphellophora europaea CBS 101466]ETN47225.1 hypothetical protein HMPREF1541_01416 [Cyphellophora europaea CBS 101466]
MAPSRGAPIDDSSDDVAIQQQGNTALINARRNFKYLIDPGAADRPARLRTRAFLRTFRYITQFIFWRIVRWAKYAAVGAIAAAIGATAFGGAVTGVAWIAAPPTIGASIIAATVWGVGKYAARKLHKRWQRSGGDAGEAARELQEQHPLKREGTMGQETGPQAIPW